MVASSGVIYGLSSFGLAFHCHLDYTVRKNKNVTIIMYYIINVSTFYVCVHLKIACAM